jgi:hypothetical protein
MRFATAAVSYGLAGPLGRLATRSAKVPDPPFQWDIVEGPWYDNNLATLEVVDDGLRIRWETGVIDNGDQDNPQVELVASVTITDAPPSRPPDVGMTSGEDDQSGSDHSSSSRSIRVMSSAASSVETAGRVGISSTTSSPCGFGRRRLIRTRSMAASALKRQKSAAKYTVRAFDSAPAAR